MLTAIAQGLLGSGSQVGFAIAALSRRQRLCRFVDTKA